MKKQILIFGFVALFTACKNNNDSSVATEAGSAVTETKEEVTGNGLKSAKYESETVMPGGMGTSVNRVIFDDYGKKSRAEIQTTISFGGKSMNSTNHTLRVDGYIYTWQNGKKTGTKIKIDESKFDPNNMDFSKLTDEMRKKMNIKEEGMETINDRECKVVSFSSEEMAGKVWTWKQIPVKVEMSVVGKTVTSSLKTLEENPAIPAGTFDVPTDIDFEEMNLPATAQK